MNLEKLLSERSKFIKGSAIRELLKLGADKNLISLGGGLPSPDSFPLDLLPQLTEKVIANYGSFALQYDMTEGFIPLREALLDYLKYRNIPAAFENIFITSGSQGFLDCIGKILISPGDYVAVESPTYLAALQAFNTYEPRYASIETDEEGLIPESLEKILMNYPIKFIYSVPTFQNPTGKTIKTARRLQVASIIKKYNILLVEDDPYSSLRYYGEDEIPLKTLAPDNVVYTSTFSKIFAPGIRVGFFVAPPELGRWMVLAKQAVDLNTSTLSQALATEYLTGGYMPAHIQKVIALYRPKLETMLTTLNENLDKGYSWSKPDGGMFLWLTGPKGLDMENVLKLTLKRGVGFVPGKFFFPNPTEGLETMRLNFTNVTDEQLKKAVIIISDVLKEETETILID
jgi:2-aminoadipate transaminase